MMADASISRGGHGWQLILADLALILFLLTLSALPATEPASGRRPADTAARGEEARPDPAPDIAASQALFRPITGGLGIGEWLGEQAVDPRATLTVFATYREGGEAAAWEAARGLAAKAEATGVRVRTIITAGAERDLYASLAYDTPSARPDG